ncbi:Protein of unknown function DUF111 [Saccharicrinis carchari]|uniref:TIGR00299 family protein n=1 Tax=Saccharicrinis carchari TaxID=1168039 RepID=A0A521CIA0_SACCC|nr:nickel insertion protein [Saccharicrinis carchari]SMO59223.1 Protein of unknown function DUF111 [Saccharicrinis carchari]
MQLLLNPKGGVAGDMFAAALISMGAHEQKMLRAMLQAANKIGQSTISTQKTRDGATRLIMNIKHNHGHLAASKARVLLKQLCSDLKISGIYAHFATEVLEILISAEKQAHAENSFLSDHHHGHGHKDTHHHHKSHHNHLPSQDKEEEAWLHEAQDILIDIMGAAMGLQLLQAPTVAALLEPVSLGGGTIRFSHGEMTVPAPATKIIIDKYAIAHSMGPLDVELCTPTGSAILAALGSSLNQNIDVQNPLHYGTARGGKDLDIPPLRLYLNK